jgi:deazaflavin-dependent oxidoreductase (nitroreductase family)
MAGRRWFPGWAVVHHRGRKTGRALSVPVAVIVTPEVFVINLPWGPGTNWVRNVVVAGGCVVRWKGVDHPVTRPELVDKTAARRYYGRVAWAIVRRLFPADTWLVLHRQHDR